MDVISLEDDDDDVIMLEPTIETINVDDKTQVKDALETDTTGEDCIEINDEKPKVKKKTCSSKLTIDIHEEFVPNVPDEVKTRKETEEQKLLAFLNKNDALMDKIVLRCENTSLKTQVRKTLLPLYKKLDSEIKGTKDLTHLLKLYLEKFRYDPDNKFNHIKSLYNDLQCGRFSGKIKLPGLAASEKKFKGKLRKKIPPNKVFVQSVTPEKQRNVQAFKKRRVSTIMETITREHELNMVTIRGECGQQKEKYNARLDESGVVFVKSDNAPSTINIDHDYDDIVVVPESRSSEDRCSNKENTVKSEGDSEYDLLVPVNSIAPHEEDKAITLIKARIATLKVKLRDFELREVDLDSKTSPYVQADRMKAMIVGLYKELCEKMYGSTEEIMRRHRVHLQVAKGHPEGPVRRLEKLLNETTDSTGVVQPPDFNDVITCVEQANVEENLGLTRQQIMKEALAIFTQCCKALRVRRQQREYRDLMSLASEQNEGMSDEDPADKDAELQARLEQNKRIAEANENKIINEYVLLDDEPQKTDVMNARIDNMVELRAFHDSDSGSDFETPMLPKKVNETEIQNDKRTTEIDTPKIDLENETNTQIKTEKENLGEVIEIDSDSEIEVKNEVVNDKDQTLQELKDATIQSLREQLKKIDAPATVVKDENVPVIKDITIRNLRDEILRNIHQDITRIEAGNKANNGNEQKPLATRVLSNLNGIVDYDAASKAINALNGCSNADNNVKVNDATDKQEATDCQESESPETENIKKENNSSIDNFDKTDSPSENSTLNYKIKEEVDKDVTNNNVNIKTEENTSTIKLETCVKMESIDNDLGASSNCNEERNSQNIPRTVKLKSEIKEEPKGHLLKSLRDDYVCAAIDDDEPILIIDISSDSDDEDDEL
ncbi:uncharacterized protein LOC142979425 [Anticarsia gemmatalis]|uniref:uncharacterized protein LOC142979425 n=1 Tax=Anticarsia gemmatalis TaxID=129554 RepID=UPI003F775DAD